MIIRTFFASSAVLVALALTRPLPAEETKSALEADPAGWTDIAPGKDLKGWTRLPVGGKVHQDVEVWKFDEKTGVLTCLGHLPPPAEGKKGGGSHEFFRYDKELADFIFHVEFRFIDPDRKGWNSGVYARNSADGKVWHQAQVGNKSGGYFFGSTPDADGKNKGRNFKATENRVKGVGEWTTYEITAKGDKMTLWVNGAVTSEWPELKVMKGYIGLEAEFHHIEFRNIKLKELK